MKRFIVLLFVVIVYSCSPNPSSYVDYIEGYWEIDEVILHNGFKKVYNYNDTIDYFELSDSLTGFRKKMKPNFSGTFETSNDAEQFKIVVKDDSLNIYYKTPYSSWKETVLSATKEQLKIINENKDVYLYKRYKPLNLE